MGQTSAVSVTLNQEMQFVAQTSSGHQVILDAAEQFGGENAGPQPMQVLLVSLAGCTGMDVISILRKMRQEVESYQVRVTGRRAEEHPKIYTHIDVEHIVTGQVDEKRLAHAIYLSHTKYCPVMAMLQATAKIETRYSINPDQ